MVTRNCKTYASHGPLHSEVRFEVLIEELQIRRTLEILRKLKLGDRYLITIYIITRRRALKITATLERKIR